MNAWSHLANAPLIDWVLESLRTDLGKWTAARTAALDAALDAAWISARDAARDADRDAVWNATWDAGLAHAGIAVRAAARCVILALVAYDDCDQYLNMTYDQLLAWAMLSEKPQAVLLLPLKWIQEHECLVTLA